MIEHFGLDVVQAYMRHVQDNAEEAVRRVIDALDDGDYPYETDSGAIIRVRVARGPRTPFRDDRLHRHLGAARHQLQRALLGGAPPPSSTSSALWSPTTSRSTTAACARCGSSSRQARCSRPSPGRRRRRATWRRPRQSPAPSTRAMGVQAEGSGTMNNVTFGNERHQYYETVASGSGAGDGLPRRVRWCRPT